MFDLRYSAFAVQAVSNDVICEYELIKLFLQVSVLKSQQVCVVLERIELLFEASINFCQLFIASMVSIELTTKTDYLTADSCKLLVSDPHVSAQIFCPFGFNLLLTEQLSLGFKEEVVALIGALTVLL